MIAVVDNVTSAHNDVKFITKAAEKIRGDIQDLMKQVMSLDIVINTKALLSVLSIIMNNLDKINGQNQFARFFCREFNKAKIDDCLNRLQSALERFSVSICSSLI